MRRLVLVASVLGAVNGAAAAGAFFAVSRLVPEEGGWFAYAPLDEHVVHDPRGFPWLYVVVPLVLVVLNALLLPLAVRRGWLR